MLRRTGRVILIAALAVVPLVGIGVNASAATSEAQPQAGAPRAIATPDAETSIFIAYSKTNFGGKFTNINGCGGHDMPYAVGSYQWVAKGQSSFLYNQTKEQGVITGRLGSGTNADSKNPVGWKSILIIC